MSGFGSALLGGGLSAIGSFLGGDKGTPWSHNKVFRQGLGQQYGQRALSLGALDEFQRSLLGSQGAGDQFFQQQLADARAYSDLGRGYTDYLMADLGGDYPVGMPYGGKGKKAVGQAQTLSILAGRGTPGQYGQSGSAGAAQGSAAPSVLDEIRRLGAQRFGDYSAGAQGIMGRYDSDVAAMNPLFAKALGDTTSSKAAIEQQFLDTVRQGGADVNRSLARRGFGGSTARDSAETAIRANALGGKLGALASLDNEQASRAQGLSALRASMASGRAGMQADLFGRGQSIAQGSADQELALRQMAAQSRLGALYSPGAVNFGPYTHQSAFQGYQPGASGAQNLSGVLGNVGGQLTSYGIASILGGQRGGGGGASPGLTPYPGGGVYDVFNPAFR